MRKLRWLALAFGLLVVGGAPGDAASKTGEKIGGDCSFKGKKLYGKIKVVTAFPDLKVQVVDAFPDKCGKWKMVDAFPDVKVQMVTAFPDLKIQFVEAFPGPP
jgi:hypothetical protein